MKSDKFKSAGKHTNKIRRVYSGHDIFTETLNRFRYLFKEFDYITVSYSGGKDSTVVFNIALQVARELNKLPLRVMFLDQEAEYQATIDEVEKVMNGNKADMVFTDPPYGIDIVGDNGKVGAGNIAKNKVYSKVIADDTTEVAKKAYNIFKNVADGIMIWGGNYFVDFLEFSPSWLIWDKRLDMNSNNFADGEMVWCSFHTRVRIYKHLWNGMIQEGEREIRVHPTQKPVKMLGNILKDQTQDGDLILDVFGGSGSTLIACEQLDRICYMMELDEKYVDVIVNRYINFKQSDNDVYLIRNGEKLRYDKVGNRIRCTG